MDGKPRIIDAAAGKPGRIYTVEEDLCERGGYGEVKALVADYLAVAEQLGRITDGPGGTASCDCGGALRSPDQRRRASPFPMIARCACAGGGQRPAPRRALSPEGKAMSATTTARHYPHHHAGPTGGSRARRTRSLGQYVGADSQESARSCS